MSRIVMYNYKTYIQEINAIIYKEAIEIYEKLITLLDFNKVDTKELWNEIIDSLIKV